MAVNPVTFFPCAALGFFWGVELVAENPAPQHKILGVGARTRRAEKVFADKPGAPGEEVVQKYILFYSL